MRRLWMTIGACLVLISPMIADDHPGGGQTAEPTHPEPIDATSLHHKVLCGYQGWFRCPGDPAGDGWRHWSRDPDRITPDTLTFEMWPDLTEYTAEEKYPASGFTALCQK